MLMYPEEDKVILLGTMWRLVENKDGCYLQLSLGHNVINVGLFELGPDDKARTEIAEYIKAAAAMLSGKRHA